MRNMCQQKLRGWLIEAWDGKSQDQVGIQCILFHICFSCDSVKRGEQLTKAWIINGNFVLEFEHFLNTGRGGGGQPKSKYIFLFASIWKIFLLLFSHWISPLGPCGLVVAMSISISICLYIPLPYNFFRPFDWPSYQMISSWPVIRQPTFPSSLLPCSPLPTLFFLSFSAVATGSTHGVPKGPGGGRSKL